MVFIEHNSLKSDIFFNPIFIPCFSGSMLFRVQVFLSPGFSGSRFFRVWVQVQGPGPGFRSSLRRQAKRHKNRLDNIPNASFNVKCIHIMSHTEIIFPCLFFSSLFRASLEVSVKSSSSYKIS